MKAAVIVIARNCRRIQRTPCSAVQLVRLMSLSKDSGTKTPTSGGAPKMPPMPDMATLMKDPAMMAAAKEMMANPSMMAAAMKVMQDPSMQRSMKAMATGKAPGPDDMPDMAILSKFMAELEQIERAKPPPK